MEMRLPKIATRAEWLRARQAFLTEEKNFTRRRAKLAEARRRLPMVEVEAEYVFGGPRGPVNLRGLFAGRRQLVVYHFMFDPDRTEGCKHCSCVMDNLAGCLSHLPARDTSFVAVSRAPMRKIAAFRRRMQWKFLWVSSFRSSFNYDYHATLDPARSGGLDNYRESHLSGELPGLSVFLRDGERIFHSYSTYRRGLDVFLPMYHLLDATPLGRQEESGNSMAAGEDSWIRHHDRY